MRTDGSGPDRQAARAAAQAAKEKERSFKRANKHRPQVGGWMCGFGASWGRVLHGEEGAATHGELGPPCCMLKHHLLVHWSVPMPLQEMSSKRPVPRLREVIQPTAK